jgi:hypothetical protein
MLNENQIPETEVFIVELTHYEKHLIQKTLRKEKESLQRSLMATYMPTNPERKIAVEKKIAKTNQKISDLKRVEERIRKTKWTY